MRYVIMTGIISLTVIEVCALFNGIDGTLMMVIIAAIAAAIGITIPTPNFLKK